MSNIVFCNYYDELNRDNFMFKATDVSIGDNLLAPMLCLKEYAESRGVTVSTVDGADLAAADAIVFMDRPEHDNVYFRAAYQLHKPLYLVVLESKLVRPGNYEKDTETIFRKIFTYDDLLVDEIKYIKLNYTYLLPKSICKELSVKKKLCVMIAGNKMISHPLELYSKRLEAVRWFEKHHPDDFDLYGVGWDVFNSPVLSLLNRFDFCRRLAAGRFPSYRGRVERKKPVLQQ